MIHRKYGVYFVERDWLAILENRLTVPLRENGFKVVGYTTNPGKAIEDIVALKPEVVICELDLSETDGITLMQKVKKAGIDCDFILLAGTRTLDLMRRFFHSGGCDYCCYGNGGISQ